MTNGTAPPPATGNRPRAWRLHAVVSLVVVLGIGCVGLAFAVPAALSEPPLWRLALLVAVILVGESAVLHLKFGRETYTFTWSEASIILGLTLAPWPWLSIVSPLAAAVAHAAARRDPVKIAYNAASMAVGATLAMFCARMITGGREVTTVGLAHQCAALAAAACLYFLWSSLSVSMAIAAARGLPFGKVVREGLPLKLAVLGGNTIVGLLLVTAQWRGSSVVLIPFSIALLYLAYRGYLRAMEERDTWQQLDQTAKELSLLDEHEVAAVAVGRAAQLFKAEVVELAIVPADGGPVRIVVRSGEGTQTVREERRRGTVAGPGPGTSVYVMPNGTATTWVVTPLDGIGGLHGTLRLGLPGTVTLSERQRQVLSTFVYGVSTSLQNARLYGEMRHQADRNAYEAAHDPLTGLPNRKALYEHGAQALAAAEHGGGNVGLLLLDLDYFKEINDTLGHNAGDAVLRSVGRRLTGALRGADLVARLGGDEFAVLLRGIGSAAGADMVARDLLAVLAEPVDHEGMRLVVGGSIGVACSPEDGTTVEDLLRGADVAMYQAKESRGTFARYRSDQDESSVSRITLTAELRNAISRDEFVLHFQPQVDMATGAINGAEVLTRWQHPTRGLLGPIDFIGVVEHSGLIREFTLHIVDRGVAECAAWRRLGVDIPVSVNLSARNLLDHDLPKDIELILARHGLPPHQLILEITETAMMSHQEVVEEVLGGLRAIGAELSIDDFGTGYSSLSLLKRAVVNEIKVDRTFVQAMTTSVRDTAIVRATIELAHGLGLRVVAEGVETAEHVAALRGLGCDGGQGWHFGRPADSDRMRELLGLSWAAGAGPEGSGPPAHGAPADLSA